MPPARVETDTSRNIGARSGVASARWTPRSGVISHHAQFDHLQFRLYARHPHDRSTDHPSCQPLGDAGPLPPKLSLTQAIETAERQGDGKAIEAEFDAGNDQASHYEVKVLGRDKLVSYTLDADTGKVLETSNEAIEKLFTRLEPDDVRAARTTLAQAIGIAEQLTNGKVIDAEVDREGDGVRYDVTVARSDGGERELEIDGATGKIVEGR